MKISSVVSVAQDVLFQEVNGETVLLNLNNESYFGLDQVGTRIWQLISEYGDPQKICAVMMEEYDVAEVQMQRDLNNLIARLAEAGLVKVVTEK